MINSNSNATYKGNKGILRELQPKVDAILDTAMPIAAKNKGSLPSKAATVRYVVDCLGIDEPALVGRCIARWKHDKLMACLLAEHKEQDAMMHKRITGNKDEQH